MMRGLTLLVVAAMLICGAAPAYAGAIDQTPVSSVEDGAFAAQQAADAPQLEGIDGGAAGTGITLLAGAAVCFGVLILISLAV